MATVEAPPIGVSMEQECKQLFRNRVMGRYCDAFNSLDMDEGSDFSAPTEESIDRAWKLYCQLNIRNVLPTKILPSPEGGVGICFCINGRYADFECFNTGETLVGMSDRRGKIEVFAVDPRNEKEVDDVISRIGQFLRPVQDALPLAASCR